MEFLEEILNNKYIIQRKIAENSLSEIYLAYTTQNGKNKCSIKILNNQVVSDRIEDIIRFHNEISKISKISSPRIERIYELIEYDNIQYLVTEFIEGKSIYALLNEKYKFTIAEVVDLIIKVAEGLRNAHKNGIIHRDLNPTNIIILYGNLSDPEIKIIDFGISKIKEFIKISDPEEVINTFCYKSPEECGVLDRNVEESSDLYSLGILMFHLLTGMLPYKGDTVSSIIHQHIAKEPEAPHSINPEIPEILSKIVIKLIEKEPGRRYQSTRGLVKDLGLYKKGEKSFELGLEDEVVNISYKTNLIGREKEFATLKGLLDKAIKDLSGSMCIIFGQSGLGKSRLVNECIEFAYSDNIAHITGRCFTGENKIPYAPFKEALNQYLMKFRTYSVEKRGAIQAALHKKISYFGKIIVDLMPELQEITGETQELININDKVKENSRFLMALSRFFFFLAEIENGLVIYFDDLQWADEGSFELLMEILGDINNYPLLILCTSRDEKVPDSHGLMLVKNKAVHQNLPLVEISLEYFNRDNMYDYISTILHSKTEETREIADFIYTKSKGNPFFSIEIIKQLINDKVINYKNEKWNIQKDILDKLEISSAVIDVVLQRIALLTAVEKDILSYAAIIGREFEISLLFSLCDCEHTFIIEVVDKAISLHLMEYEIQDKKKIFFVHERIKEAFYEIIPAAARKILHIKIARTLESLGKHKNEDMLFDLAYHYICGEQEDKILEYTYPAGLKAKANYAFEEAERYFIKTLNILEKRNLTGSGQWIEVTRKQAEVCLMIGKYDKGIILLTSVLPYLTDILDRANVYKQITEAYFRKGDNDKCEESGKRGLALLREKLPVNRVLVLMGIAGELCMHILHILFPLFFVKKKVVPSAEKYKLIMLFYFNLSWLYILADESKFLRSTLRMLNISEFKIGKSKELAASISAYAALCMAIPLFKRSLRYHEKALWLKKEIQDEYGIAQSLQFLGFCYEWMGKYKNAIAFFEKSADIFKKVGDIKEYGTTLLGIATSTTYLADYQAAEEILKTHNLIAVKSQDAYAICANLYNSAKLNFETGLIEEAEKLALKGYKKSLKNELWFIHCCLCLVLCEIFLNKENYKQAFAYIEEASELHLKYKFLTSYIGFLYPLYVECHILQYVQEREFTLQVNKSALYKIRRVCKEALYKTKPWVTHYSAALLVYAKYLLLAGKNKKAEKYFIACIKHSENTSRPYERAKGIYEYGLFLRQLGKEVEALRKIRWAYQIFTELKSEHYIKKIEVILGLQNRKSHTLKSRFIDNQRFSSIIEVSQDIGSILDVDELYVKVQQKAVEITGAQQGYLFIVNEDTERLDPVTNANTPAHTIPQAVLEFANQVYTTDQSIISRGSDEDKQGSILCVPLRSNQKVIGVCFLENKLSNAVFSEEDKEVLEIIMTQAAICIINARLYALATTDGLTKLFIHRHFQHLLEQEIKRAHRYDRKCSLIMIDVDYFKIFNDRYGHQLGDKVLMAVARIIKDNCRDTDLASRYGGEEFCIILPEAAYEDALKVAEKIREKVANYRIPDHKNEQPITISLGIAVAPDHAQTKDELIKAADTALYIAKRNGRNQVAVYTK